MGPCLNEFIICRPGTGSGSHVSVSFQNVFGNQFTIAGTTLNHLSNGVECTVIRYVVSEITNDAYGWKTVLLLFKSLNFMYFISTEIRVQVIIVCFVKYQRSPSWAQLEAFLRSYSLGLPRPFL